MKLLSKLIIFSLLYHCSFDTKSGIWKNENISKELKKNPLSEFKTLSSSRESFNSEVNKKSNLKILISKKINNLQWNDEFYNSSNNYDNFEYTELNKLSFKSKKLSRHKLHKSILFQSDNLVLNDEKGNIIIYSLKEKKILRKFNFYRKKLKNIKKNLNLFIDENIIYVSDNIGYLYAYNLKINKIVWAKNYKIPFRSNLKIYKDKLIAVSQNNNLFFFNKHTGTILREIPTEENTIKNNFVNNLSLNDNKTFFLNSFGSLYAINNQTMRVSWFVNLNQSLDFSKSSLFSGNQVINYKDKIVVSSNKFIYILDALTGTILFKKNFTSIIKPIISEDNLFLISKNNLLICLNIVNGEISYSYNINKKIADFLKTKERRVYFKNIFLINNSIYIFLKNSFLLKFDLDGVLKNITKLPLKLNSDPILINKSILYLDRKNRLSVVN